MDKEKQRDILRSILICRQCIHRKRPRNSDKKIQTKKQGSRKWIQKQTTYGTTKKQSRKIKNKGKSSACLWVYGAIHERVSIKIRGYFTSKWNCGVDKFDLDLFRYEQMIRLNILNTNDR